MGFDREGYLVHLATPERQPMSPLLPIHATHLLEIVAPKDAFSNPTGSQCVNTCQTSALIKASELAQPHILPCWSP